MGPWVSWFVVGSSVFVGDGSVVDAVGNSDVVVVGGMFEGVAGRLFEDVAGRMFEGVVDRIVAGGLGFLSMPECMSSVVSLPLR